MLEDVITTIKICSLRIASINYVIINSTLLQVGAVDIESGWSTGYNNFQFDTHKYPNASEMVEYFHSKKIRVILWATSMINTDSSNYKEAHDKKYLLKFVDWIPSCIGEAEFSQLCFN